MRKFNKALNKDITALKTLHTKKDKSEFNKMKEEIMKQHKISKATVYREMKKEQPGYYRSPKYNPPIREITEKEKELVSGMLFRQMPVEQVRAEMEKLTGESYSWERIDKIRDASGTNTQEIPEVKMMPGGVSDAYEYESPNGEDMKLFVEKIMSIDKMEPRNFITIPVKGYGFKLGYAAVKDIQRIVANSAAVRGQDAAEISNIVHRHMCFEEVRLLSQGKAHNTKDLVELGKLIKGFEPAGGGSTGIDFEFMVDIIKSFAGKKVTREDVVYIVSVRAANYPGLSQEMKPPYKESLAAAANWAGANM